MTETLAYGIIFGWMFIVIIIGLIFDRYFFKKSIDK